MSHPGSGPPDEDELPDFLAGDVDHAPPVERSDLTALRRRLLANDLVDALAAVDEMATSGHAELQAELTTFFYVQTENLDHDAVERVLDCLASVGDGRCVRGMERVLHERWQHLSEHQAWRGRHIVQSIRRCGRK